MKKTPLLFEKLNDAELLALVKLGNSSAFETIFEKYWADLLNFACTKTKSVDIGKEIVQQIFIDIWERKEKLAISNLRNYLFTSAKYKIIKELKSQNKFEDICDDIRLSYQNLELENAEFHTKFENLLSKLPIKSKEIFLKSRIEEKSNREISEELNISHKTVEYHITKSLKYLKSGFKWSWFSIMINNMY